MAFIQLKMTSTPATRRSLLAGLLVVVGLAGCWRDSWSDCVSRCNHSPDSRECNKQCHVLYSSRP